MEKNCSVEWGHSSVPDLDLEIWRGGGGGGGGRAYSPWDKGGGGGAGRSYRPCDKRREGGGLQIIFSTLRALLWSKNTGGGRGPPGPSPGSANVLPAKST